MKHSEQINDLSAALCKAQGVMKGAVKDSTNPYFKSQYADLESVWQACRAPLSDNGLCVFQGTKGSDGFSDQAPDSPLFTVTLVTILSHVSGQWMSGDLTMSAADDNPQTIGKLITYMRRYGLAAMVGVCPEDDDGNSASRPSSQAKVSQKTKKEVIRITLECLESGDSQRLYEAWSEFSQEEKISLWGNFTAQERALMKKMMTDEHINQEPKGIRT